MINVPGNEIHLWVVDEEQPGIKDLQQAYRALLSPEDEKRYERLIFARHKRQFLLTRALLRDVLSKYLENTRPADVKFARNAYGKPRIASFGRSSPVEFNLSHTDGLSVLAVAARKQVGVDVESLWRQADILALAQRYFSPEETRDLKALPVARYNDRFFDLWTLKEAYIKACGLGLRIPLHDFSFQLDEKNIGISFVPERDDDPLAWRFWQYALGNRYRVALAVKPEVEGRTGETGGTKEEAGKATRESMDDYRLIWRQGWPLAQFTELSPWLLRQN